jgi:hypothetical protein
VTLPFAVRKGTETDLPFIENAWRSTMLATCPAAQGAEPRHFHGEMTRVFHRLLGDATIKMACDPKDEDNLVGFVAHRGPELYYAYVAGPFRNLGIVPALLEGTSNQRYHFQTMPGVRRLKPRERGWSFCPRFTIY